MVSLWGIVIKPYIIDIINKKAPLIPNSPGQATSSTKSGHATGIISYISFTVSKRFVDSQYISDGTLLKYLLGHPQWQPSDSKRYYNIISITFIIQKFHLKKK